MHTIVGLILHIWFFKLFCLILDLDEVGFPKALLPIKLVPSTSTPYFGSVLNIL
jgi:hypothetical protein